MSQEICYINGNGKIKLFTVYAYIKELSSIVGIDNKRYNICYKLKTPVELVTDKLSMYLDGLHTFNPRRQIDYPKCTILEKDTVVLDVIFHTDF